MSPVRPTTLFALLALTLVGCATGSGAQVELKGHRFGVEIADNDDERSRGLMYRESMDPDHGMLFVFEEDAPRTIGCRPVNTVATTARATRAKAMPATCWN